MIDKLGLDGLGGASVRKPNKLTALVEAAKNSNSDDCNVSADALAGWGDEILELCALLEKAEEALKAQVEDKRDGPFFHEDEHLPGSCLRNSEQALDAIKQWKEQT